MTRNKCMPSLVRFFQAAALVLLTAFNAGAVIGTDIQMDPASQVSIRFESGLQNLPLHGYLPLRVHIRNQSGATRRWQFDAVSRHAYMMNNRQTSSHQVELENQGDREFEMLIPLAVADNGNFQPSIEVRVSGYGTTSASVFNRSDSYHRSSGSGPMAPFIGLSAEVATRFRGPLEASCATQSIAVVFTTVEAAALSADPRGYTGLDALWLSVADWRRLTPSQSLALGQWVRQGGRLAVAGAESGPPADLAELGLGVAGSSMAASGFGRVEAVRLPDGATAEAAALAWLRSIRSRTALLSQGLYQAKTWSLRDGLPVIDYPMFLILGFVIVFAVLLGPVNIWIAARRKRHAQILWTTPLLSLLASVLLAGVIVMKDGFGGVGNRFSVVVIDPVRHEMTMLREQVSRTGVLFSRSFALADTLVMYPLNVDAMLFARAREYALSDGTAGGSWFSSRSLQGQLIQGSEPTRGRIEILAGGGEGGAPAGLSSLAMPLRRLYYQDAAGAWWTVEGLRTGERKAMVASNTQAYLRWWRDVQAPAGEAVRDAMARIADQQECFYAEAETGRGALPESLPSIRWNDRAVIVAGPVAMRGGAQ